MQVPPDSGIGSSCHLLRRYSRSQCSYFSFVCLICEQSGLRWEQAAWLPLGPAVSAARWIVFIDHYCVSIILWTLFLIHSKNKDVKLTACRRKPASKMCPSPQPGQHCRQDWNGGLLCSKARLLSLSSFQQWGEDWSSRRASSGSRRVPTEP